MCLKIAKYKTENKELLHYLLFYQDRKDDYVNEVKELLNQHFDDLFTSVYYMIKQLRKITRLMNKHIKYIGEKNRETELLIHFCEQFLQHASPTTSHKALITILYRQLKRVTKLIPKLPEDLQFDYQQQLDAVLVELKKKRPSFSKREIE